MAKLLERLGAWLETNAEEFFAQLIPGFSEEQLLAIEADCGLPIPDSFRRFLSWRQLGPDADITFVWPYAGQWCTHQQFVNNQMAMRELAGLSDSPDREASVHWLVFREHFQYDIDSLCVDMKGTLGGQAGQVLFYRGEDRLRQVVAASFNDYLRVIVESLEAGLWTVADDCIEPEDWDRMDEFLAERLETPDISIDLDEASSDQVAAPNQVQKEMFRLEQLARETSKALKEGALERALDLSAAEERVAPSGTLRHPWESVTANRALALFGLGRDAEARSLVTLLRLSRGHEVMNAFWRPVLEAADFEVATAFQILLERTELTTEILKMAQNAKAIHWQLDYPFSEGSFTFQPGEVSWSVKLRIQSEQPMVVWLQVVPGRVSSLLHRAHMSREFNDHADALQALLEACQECERFQLQEYAARLYAKALELGYEMPGKSDLSQVPLTEFSARLVE